MDNDEKTEELFREVMNYFDKLNGSIWKLGERLANLVSHGEVHCEMSCVQPKKSRFDRVLDNVQWFLLGMLVSGVIFNLFK